MSLRIIFSILATHYIADFVLQSHWMAINKSKKFLPLASHVTVYTLASMAFLTLLVTKNIQEARLVIGFCALNGLLHLGTDFITSRINAKLWEKGEVHWFFVGIGFDQWIHYLCLFGTWSLMHP